MSPKGDGEDKGSVFDKLYGKVTSYEADPSRTAEEIADIRKMLESNPESLDLKEWLAVKLYSGDFLEEAIALLEELISKGHSLENMKFYLGNALYKRGDLARAVACWKYVVDKAPHKKRGKKASARMKKAIEEMKHSP